MAIWIHKVKTTSVSEGPAGTLGRDKTPQEMVRALLRANPGKEIASIAKYVQFFLNRGGKNYSETHRDKVEKAKTMLWDIHHGRRTKSEFLRRNRSTTRRAS